MIAAMARFAGLSRLLLACLCAWMPCAHAEVLKPWTGGATPELQAKTLAGEEIRLSNFAGRTVLVNFWATWCAPCVAEMPSLQRLRDKLGAQKIEVIAVNFQENPARIQPFVDRLNLTLPVVRDHDGSLRTAWRVNVFPSTFVVGPDQKVVLQAIGEVDWDDPAVESRIRSVR
jgi:thiol-disulfide isomerase/thioredoxin